MKRYARVDRRGGPDACWPWRGAVDSYGYGQVYVNRGERRRQRMPAHRWIYLLDVGPVPDGHVIRHTCDNPPCCNPAHLLTGTQKQNMTDALERGRLQDVKGEDHPHAKLTESDVREIRRLLAESRNVPFKQRIRQKEIALLFDITPSNVSQIKRGRAWTHVV